MEEKPKYRIGILAIIVLVVLAGIFDLLTLIPFVGDFLGWFFWVLASIYFWKIGMGLINGKRLATMAISIIIELIPAVQWLPGILAGIIAIIVMTRIEDKTGISLNPLQKKPGITAPRIQNVPLNQNGQRLPRKI